MNIRQTLICLLALMPSFIYSQIYVDQFATGSGNGSSWENAYTDLQDALANANIGAEIWVAKGIYLPSDNNDVTATFNLLGSISLYGGFKGSETSIDMRRIEDNPTVLSGDYNGNDNVVVNVDPLDLTFQNFSDNANRIITASNVTGTIIIDGFTVAGGRAPSSGGGMLFAPDGTLTVIVRNCTVKENFSSDTAGAIRLGASAGEVLNFSLEQCIAMHNECNSFSSKGGVLWSTGSGLVNTNYENCLFYQNYSRGRGGVISHDVEANVKYLNCVFSGNIASAGGALFENTREPVNITNCTFYNNEASENFSGAAIQNWSDFGSEDVNIYNCIFYENNERSLVGRTNSGYNIQNSIIDYPNFSSLLSDASASTNLGANQFGVDPQFVDGLGLDHNLSDNSPAINVGENSLVLTDKDQTGKIDRIVDDIVDLGAFEYHLPMNADLNAALCFGETFAQVELSVENYPDFTYEWSDPSIEGPNPQDLTEGDYSVTVTNAIGDEEVFDFTLAENPEIIVNFEVVDPTDNNPDGAAIANVSNGVFPFTYEWDTDPVQTTFTASGLAEGIYTLTVTDANGCQKVEMVKVGDPSSVQSIDDIADIEIGPNPFVEKIIISLKGDLLQRGVVEQVLIYDAMGRLVHQHAFNALPSATLELGHFASGMYLLELRGAQDRFSKRLIKP